MSVFQTMIASGFIDVVDVMIAGIASQPTALLGMRSGRGKATTPAVSTRLERRLKLIERMPAKPKQQLIGLIDTFIAAAHDQQKHVSAKTRTASR